MRRGVRAAGLMALSSALLAGCVAPSMARRTPLQRIENPHPQTAWVGLRDVGCTGRRDDCPTYSVRIFADGGVRWEGEQLVDPLGSEQSTISAARARRAIAHARRRAPELAARECGHDHARYFEIVLGEPGQNSLPVYWSCGRPYRATARRIRRAAGVSRQRFRPRG